MPTTKICKSVVDRLKPETKVVLHWDSTLKGFGVKVTPKGKKTYVCQYRALGQKNAKRFTIGVHGVFTADQARNEAKKLLGLVATGEDPSAVKKNKKEELTVAELCDDYVLDGCGTKKASTIETDRGRIERHIKPLLGMKKISDVTRSDVKKFLTDVASGKTSMDIKTGKYGRAIVTGGKGTATRTTGLLGAIFTFAVESGLLPSNPVQGVKRFRDKQNKRFLSEEEVFRLSGALRSAESAGHNPAALAIIRLLLLTGARRDEIAGLKWKEVDFENGKLLLEDTKEGQQERMLSPAALEILSKLPRQQDAKFVFPAIRGNGYYVGTPKVWAKIRSKAGFHDVRLHDLRHSFASFAVSSGISLPIIGALLGHADSRTTQQYAHLFDDPLRRASDKVAGQIDKALRSIL